MGITVVICGDVSEDVIDLINRKYTISKIGYGGVNAPVVYNWALKNHIEVETQPLDHHKFGEKAIFVQHLKLLKELLPDLIVVKENCGLIQVYLESIAKDMNLQLLKVK